jgi:hypothetical protein
MPRSPASTATRQIMPASRVVPMALLCLSGALLLSPGVHADSWKPFPPEELTGAIAPLEPDAAAEVLDRKIEIDDSQLPQWRTTTEYTRYKIFDPERADNIVRLSELTAEVFGDNFNTVDMSARLTLPDGTTKEFGAESVHEQNVVRENIYGTIYSESERVEVKQKFLAVGGAQPGSILEFKVRTVERFFPRPVFRPLQIRDVPIRRLEYIHQLAQSHSFQTSFFVINGSNLETKEDKRSLTVTLTGHDLPSLHDEPFSGVPSYYSATAVTCYDANSFISFKGTNLLMSRDFTPEMGPWAPCATVEYALSQNHVEVTKEIKKTAAEITRGATSNLEKAQRIHDYVQNLHEKFVRQGKKLHEFATLEDSIVNMHDVLHFEEWNPPLLQSRDFLWLEISLDRAAGLHTETLLLPNRTVACFDPRLPSKAFLPETCAAIEIDGQWHFSMPQLRTSIPFDQLPWPLEGQQGLLALDSKQEFIDVPAAPPGQSVTRNEGTFTLDAAGTLTGQCKRTLTGHWAYDLRALLSRKTEPDNIMKQILLRELDPAEIEITGIENLDDCSKPVEISYTLTWTGFATVADSRMFLHPFVFRTKALSPFTATERHNPVYFPFKQRNTDHLTIEFPAGYELEVKAAPASHPGDILSHTVDLGYNAKHHTLYVDRDFSSSLMAVELSDYARLKNWYDAVEDSDQYQLILVRKATPVAANQAAP